jgi:hypothetical protein
MPDSGEFRPASLRSVVHQPRHGARVDPLSAAPFRNRNSPETGPNLTPARTRIKNPLAIGGTTR